MENNVANEKLMTAVINGNIENAIEAIEGGASIHIKTTKGNNLLYVAASRDKDDMFDWLLEVEQADKKINLDNKNNDGSTALLEFITENGFTPYVKKMLIAGANPNIEKNDGMSPLIQACADKKFDEVQLLLSHKVNVNYVIRDTQTTAFLMAASQSSMSICEVLKENGANVNALDSSGKNALLTALYKGDQFMKKKEKEEHKVLCLFLSDIGINLDYVAPSGMTALWTASLMKNKEITEFLISKNVKADVWHEIGLDGRMSAIHLWANSKEVEIVRSLYNMGAKLGVPDEKGNFAETYGFMNPSMRELMFELGGDVNAIFHQKAKSKKEKDIRVPVISNIINGGNKQRELVKKMIAKGAKVSFDDEGLHPYEPVMIAISASACDILTDLIETKQVDLNKLVKMSQVSSAITPLMLTVTGIVNQKFEAFLDKKAQYEAIKKAKEENDKNGVTSTIINEEGMKEIEKELKDMENIATQLKDQRKQIFDILIKNNVELDKIDENGNSAIFYAGTKDAAQYLKDAGANLYIKNNDKNNPLIYSILSNKIELMSFLKEEYMLSNNKTIDDVFYQLSFSTVDTHYQQEMLERGIWKYIKDEIDSEKLKEKDSIFNVKSINYQDEDGNSALLVSCANNLPFLASLYIRLGANIDLKNNNDETPLMHAISTGNDRMVEFLIEKNADVKSQTKDGKTVLDFAEEINNKNILEKVKIALGHEVVEGSISGIKKLKP